MKQTLAVSRKSRRSVPGISGCFGSSITWVDSNQKIEEWGPGWLCLRAQVRGWDAVHGLGHHHHTNCPCSCRKQEKDMISLRGSESDAYM